MLEILLQKLQQTPVQPSDDSHEAGVGFTMAFAGIGTCVLLKIVDLSCGLRISEDEESLGLDLTQHGESAYND